MKKYDEENQKKWAQVVAKAWIDSQFKARLIANPETVLQEHDIFCGKNMKCKVIEADKNEVYFVLPSKPEGNLSETELKNIAAASGTDCSAVGSQCT